MVIKRDSNCPLCGARLTASELLDAGTELIDAHLGIVEARCPHCQGYLEVMPGSGRLDIGYRIGTGIPYFDKVLSLSYAGLVVWHEHDSTCMTLKAPGQAWEFRA